MPADYGLLQFFKISEILIYMDHDRVLISIIKMPSGCQRAMTFKPNCGIK